MYKYIIGEDERLDKVNENITLIQKKNGLTFGTDAFLLYAFLRAQSDAVAVDLGAGTGIISLLAAAGNKFKKIFAVEIQPAFIELIEKNVELNGLDGRVIPLCADVCKLTVADVGVADAVFSNPPYMKLGSGKINDCSQKQIARHEICGNIGKFCECASRILKYGGAYYVVWRPDRVCDLLCAMREYDIEPKRMTYVYPDVKHVPSLILVEGRKGGKSGGMFITKPLIMQDDVYKDPDGYTDELKKIYENGDFDEQFQRP